MMEDAISLVHIVGGVVTLMLIAIGVRAVTKRVNIPFSVTLTLVGIGLAWVSGKSPALDTLIPDTVISPDLILYVFLPTLIFESAFNLDVRLLRDNLAHVLGLAVPGLLISTFFIGAIVRLTTSIPLAEALLLGSILSATDPVAVVSLFRQLGAPRRLTVLVEGESLFNDATAIVVSRILVGFVAAGSMSLHSVGEGALYFFFVFAGGLLVGWLLGRVTCLALGAVTSDPYIEITLTTILAYVSFLLAEEALHVSGVMATVAAGLTVGGGGRMKISPTVRTYLESFWEYVAFVATSLIFLMVGLQVKLSALWSAIDLLVWVILAMLVSRAVVVYGLLPLAGRAPGAEAVNVRYQTVMFWGGLRGAVALAIVLSLPPFPRSEICVALVTGAVLFTLVAQGLTIDRLVRFLGLDQPPLADRFARLEGSLTARRQALHRIPELVAGGLFSGSIAERLRDECQAEIVKIKERLAQLRRTEMDPDQERRLLLLFAFTEEKSLYIDMFNKGHLTERAFKELTLSLDLQLDAIRHHAEYKQVDFHHLLRRRWEKWLIASLDRTPLLSSFGERFHMARIARDYEVSWGHYQGSGGVLKELETYSQLESLPEEVVEEVRRQYRRWRETARRQLDQDAEQFPEFVSAMQERLGRRMMRLAEAEEIEERMKRGALPHGVAEGMQAAIALDIAALRGLEVEKLKLKPTELLCKVPFFCHVSAADFATMASHMRSRTFAEKEIVIEQGETGDSLFLIARGVVRVSREDKGETRDLTTLMAGDFFGEMSLLHDETRAATVRAITPCSLYELKRKALVAAMDAHPAIRHALEKADMARRNEIEQRS